MSLDSLPLGGPGSPSTHVSDDIDPESPGEVQEIQPTLSPQQEVVTITSIDDMMYGRLSRRARFGKWVDRSLHSLGSATKSASKRSGFTVQLITAVLINLGSVILISQLSTSLLRVAGFALLTVFNSYFVMKKLKNAYQPNAVAPEEAIIPEKGLPKAKYFVHRLYGRADKVPSLKPHDQRDAMIRLHEDRIRELRQIMRPVFWIANSSGKNGKSMMAVIIASIIGRVTRQPCFVVPTMANDKTGRAGKLTGLKGRSASMRKLHTLIESGDLKDPGDVYEYVFSNKDGAFVVSEDPVGDVGARYFGNGMFRTVVRFLLRASRLAVFDTGNDGAHENSVTVTGLEEAHVAILTTWIENVDGIDKLKEALGEYWRYDQIYGKVGQPIGQRQSPNDIPMSEKIVNSIVVFNAVDPESDLSQYLRHVHIDADGAPEFGGKICFVRYDEYLRYLLEGFSIDEMQPETYLDYLVVIVLAFEQAARSMGVEVPVCHPAIRDMSLRLR